MVKSPRDGCYHKNNDQNIGNYYYVQVEAMENKREDLVKF